MLFQSLTEKLLNAFKKFRNKGKLTEADVKEGMREVKLALLEADVNFKVVKDFVKAVTERAQFRQKFLEDGGRGREPFSKRCLPRKTFLQQSFFVCRAATPDRGK